MANVDGLPDAVNDAFNSSTLYRFFAACFRRDWDREGSDWQGVVDVYAVGQSPANLRALAQEIDDLRQGHPEAELETLIKRQARCAYNPRPATYQDWLGQLAGQLRWQAKSIEKRAAVSWELGQFFGAYFHQDWDLEADDWEGLVDNYVDDLPAVEHLRTLAQEIDTLYETRTEPELTQLMERTISLDYYPESLSYAVWLRQVADRLRKHADGIAAARRTIDQEPLA